MRNPSEKNPAELLSVCRSFAETSEDHDQEIQVVGTALGEAILRDAGGEIAAAKGKLIEAVRAGQHVELSVRATTFRQKDGSPNKNFLRFKSSKLGEIGSSYVGRPFLLDHNKWSQEARMGTILKSEAVPLAGGWTGFRQTLHVVKPHGVISVLDGTLDAFSIGWDPSGTVICSAHGTDVRSRKSCYWTEGCYPGKLVEVDGKSQIAEYEWQSTTGTEVSGVNSPAVGGTKIEDVRTALAAELSLTPPTLDERKAPDMDLLATLAAILGVATLTEPAAAAAVRELKDGRLAAEQERDSAIKRAELAEGKIAAAELSARTVLADAKIADAYKAGKLIKTRDAAGGELASPREARLRRIASETDGLAALDAELAEMPIVVPIGRAVLTEEDPNPKASSGPISRGILASVAKQLGHDPAELDQHAITLTGGASRDDK